MSDIKQAAWLKRPEVDYPEVSKDYPYCNVLGPSTNKSRRRLNNTTVFLLITVVLYGLSWLLFH